MKVPNAPVPAPAGPTHPFEPFTGEFESGTDKITIKETCPLNSNFRESRNINYVENFAIQFSNFQTKRKNFGFLEFYES